MKFTRRACLNVWIILICIVRTSGTLSKSDKSKNAKSEKYKPQQGPKSQNVISRNLVAAEPRAKDIVAEHATYHEEVHKRNFNGKLLGFVTPWNEIGYNIARTFTSKFTHISPVWLQIKRRRKLRYEVTGEHDIDSKWLEQLRENNEKVKITPRVLFDQWTMNDFANLFFINEEQLELTNALLRVCKNNKFSGLVLEIWSQVGGSFKTDVLIDFIRFVGGKFNSSSLDLILVVPPIREYAVENAFTANHFEKLSDHVALFLLMTYDYSSLQRPGPNSPINWAKNCIKALVPAPHSEKRSKILLGINFYGNDYTASGGGPILGQQFVDLLKNYKGKLKYDNESKENFFEIRFRGEKHLVFYPTLHSLAERIKLAEELGTGISIWELGQGLNYFYDLL